MTVYEPNPEVRPTGEEPAEFLDDGPLNADPAAGTDPTRRPTGTPPLAPDVQPVDGPDDPADRSDPTEPD